MNRLGIIFLQGTRVLQNTQQLYGNTSQQFREHQDSHCFQQDLESCLRKSIYLTKTLQQNIKPTKHGHTFATHAVKLKVLITQTVASWKGEVPWNVSAHACGACTVRCTISIHCGANYMQQLRILMHPEVASRVCLAVWTDSAREYQGRGQCASTRVLPQLSTLLLLVYSSKSIDSPAGFNHLNSL